jgi:copper oxidase (laccase) domain-containing protein
MIEQGAERQHIIACVGPCIGKDSYEVGPEFKQNFLDDSKNNEQFFSPSPKEHHHMFNIAGYVLARLQAQNIDKVEHVNRDTYRDAKNFFSYRRSCHNDEPHYGRQISTICL